ncbi:hypothetical protein [Enterococcus sp. AZ109]|uniref:hypothetical protein n=1 Tax=Enterococcus sp. AZ109 TaxID=2774634 RepID=UPI003F213424
MTTEFDERMRSLHAEYLDCSPEERKFIKQYMKKNNLLLYRKTERMKHELLRMEAKRAQLSLDGKSKELTELEKKIIDKKTEFLKILAKVREKQFTGNR